MFFTNILRHQGLFSISVKLFFSILLISLIGFSVLASLFFLSSLSFAFTQHSLSEPIVFVEQITEFNNSDLMFDCSTSYCQDYYGEINTFDQSINNNDFYSNFEKKLAYSGMSIGSVGSLYFLAPNIVKNPWVTLVIASLVLSGVIYSHADVFFKNYSKNNYLALSHIEQEGEDLNKDQGREKQSSENLGPSYNNLNGSPHQNNKLPPIDPDSSPDNAHLNQLNDEDLKKIQQYTQHQQELKTLQSNNLFLKNYIKWVAISLKFHQLGYIFEELSEIIDDYSNSENGLITLDKYNALFKKTNEMFGDYIAKSTHVVNSQNKLDQLSNQQAINPEEVSYLARQNFIYENFVNSTLIKLKKYIDDDEIELSLNLKVFIAEELKTPIKNPAIKRQLNSLLSDADLDRNTNFLLGNIDLINEFLLTSEFNVAKKQLEYYNLQIDLTINLVISLIFQGKNSLLWIQYLKNSLNDIQLNDKTKKEVIFQLELAKLRVIDNLDPIKEALTQFKKNRLLTGYNINYLKQTLENIKTIQNTAIDVLSQNEMLIEQVKSIVKESWN